MKAYNDIALEDIENYSVCVRTDAGIRKIKDYRDIELGNLVFVHNVSMEDEELKVVHKDIYCRCSAINVCFRGGSLWR